MEIKVQEGYLDNQVFLDHQEKVVLMEDLDPQVHLEHQGKEVFQVYLVLLDYLDSQESKDMLAKEVFPDQEEKKAVE